jgi:hypothetical protein
MKHNRKFKEWSQTYKIATILVGTFLPLQWKRKLDYFYIYMNLFSQYYVNTVHTDNNQNQIFDI